jgi:tripartite-type tricarboxylate transporter receptor subunit TctC
MTLEAALLGKRLAFALAFGILVALHTAPAPAQPWPQRTVKFIVTLGAGSGVDIGTRLIAERLTRRWGHPVVVENRPGGDGLVAISAFVGANDDHVLLAGPSGSFTAHPFVYKNLPYKAADLVPVTRVSNTIVVLAVPASLPVKSLAELVGIARAEPGQLNWAGTTGSNEFLFAAFLKNGGLAMSKVPYRNLVEAANDLASDRIQINVTAFAIVRPQLQAGTVKLLAVTNTTRAAVVPDVPTVSEAGFPELALDGLVGFFGLPAMPEKIREGHRRRCSRGHGSGGRGTLEPDRADPQFRRARRFRRRYRTAARAPFRRRQGSRHGADRVNRR